MKTPMSKNTKFSFGEAKITLDKLAPLMIQLEDLNIYKYMTETGISLDEKTNLPYYVIIFEQDAKIDLKELPKAFEGLVVKYETEGKKFKNN